MKSQKWVATMTFAPEDKFYEEGGVYGHEPRCSWTAGARKFVVGEHVAECPRCGQRFAETESTAEANRDLHFHGDADIPSICRDMPDLRQVN